MVTLEQIRQLDARVLKAVELIGKLREENTTLKNRLGEYQDRIEELEVLISNFKEDQSEIEHGIANVLHKLASFEDGAKPQTKPARVQTEPPARPKQHAQTPAPEPEVSEPEPTDDGESELDIF